MLLSRDPVGAFMDFDPVTVPNASDGPLAGLTMAVKDIYDVAGYPTGCGNPTRLAETTAAETTSPVVQACLDAGARFVGKTITDELAFSLAGMNAHYGTPLNTRAPDRIPGGSSAGSASAVAAGLCDFAFGSDTGGSVRAPASFCGLYGLRPTHGRLSLENCMPLAPSFDTVGWFARDIAVFSRVADVLLGPDTVELPDRPATVVVDEVMSLMLPGRLDVLAPALDRVAAVLGEPAERVRIADGDLSDWFWSFRRCQGVEAWAEQGAWIEAARPDLGPGVKDRFEYSRDIAPADAERAYVDRERFRSELETLLAGGRIIVMPTVPDAAPKLDSTFEEIDTFRNRALTMLCLSGLSGLPQMQMPLGEYDGCPLGISILGPRGSDRALVSLAARICGA